jgi:hypothetical protein
MTLGIAFGALAQGEVVNKYFNQFEDNEEFVKVSLSSKMFSMMAELEPGSDEEKEFLEAVKKLKGMKIVAADSTANSAKLYEQAKKDIQGAGFEELMSVMDAEENFQFSIKEKGNTIEELIMVAGGKKRFAIISLYGEIDLKSISKIARSMNVGPMSELSKLDPDGGN